MLSKLRSGLFAVYGYPQSVNSNFNLLAFQSNIGFIRDPFIEVHSFRLKIRSITTAVGLHIAGLPTGEPSVHQLSYGFLRKLYWLMPGAAGGDVVFSGDIGGGDSRLLWKRRFLDLWIS